MNNAVFVRDELKVSTTYSGASFGVNKTILDAFTLSDLHGMRVWGNMYRRVAGQELSLTHADTFYNLVGKEQMTPNSRLCKIIRVTGEAFYYNISNRNTKAIPASSIICLISAAVGVFWCW